MDSECCRSLASSSADARATAKFFAMLDISLDMGAKRSSFGILRAASAPPLLTLFIHSDILAMGPMMLQRMTISVMTEIRTALARILKKFLRQTPEMYSLIYEASLKTTTVPVL